MEPHQTCLFGTGDPAVDPGSVVVRSWLDERCWVDTVTGWLRGGDTLLVELVDSADWRQGRRWMYDRMVDDPRLTCFSLRSGWARHPALLDARAALESRYGVYLRGPALNYYRDGRDSVAPHRDRELRELDDTLVAILTLGARRPFLMRAKAGGPSRDLAPGCGDLIVMGGATQRHWEHAVPKVAHSGPRVSVSWRWSSAIERSPDTLVP